MARDFDVEISEAEKKLEDFKNQVTQIRGLYLKATEEFIRPWYMQKAEEIVKREPEITKMIGLEGIKDLKAEIKELQENVKAKIEEFVGYSYLWWSDTYKPGPSGGPLVHTQNEALSSVAGLLGPILEKRGYKSTGFNSGNAWSKHIGGRSSERMPYYPFNLDGSPRMNELLASYKKIHQEAEKQSSVVDSLMKEKSISEATNLWDKA